jgi:hypothetical protein
MQGMDPKTSPPWDYWAGALRAVEEALLDIDVVYRDDPARLEYREYLDRKRREFRARIHRLVERN